VNIHPRRFRIFISYRAGDGGDAAIVYEALRRRYGKDRIYLDVEESWRLGHDFKAAILSELHSVPVIVVIIGATWHARIEDLRRDTDAVRLEIEAALQRRGALVIPILTGENRLDAAALPAEIAQLAWLQGVRVVPQRERERRAQLKTLTTMIDQFANRQLDLPVASAMLALSVMAVAGLAMAIVRGLFPLYPPDTMFAVVAVMAFGMAAGIGGFGWFRPLAARMPILSWRAATLALLACLAAGPLYAYANPIGLSVLDGPPSGVALCHGSYPVHMFGMTTKPDQSPHRCGDVCRIAFTRGQQHVTLRHGRWFSDPHLALDIAVAQGAVSAVRAGSDIQYTKGCTASNPLQLTLPEPDSIRREEAVVWFTIRADRPAPTRVVVTLRHSLWVVATRSALAYVPERTTEEIKAEEQEDCIDRDCR
jgi:hypothetical protein